MAIWKPGGDGGGHDFLLCQGHGEERPATQYEGEGAGSTRQLRVQCQGECVDQTKDDVDPRANTHRRTSCRSSSETTSPSAPGLGVQQQGHSMDDGRLLEPAVTCDDPQVQDAAELVTTRRAALGSLSEGSQVPQGCGGVVLGKTGQSEDNTPGNQRAIERSRDALCEHLQPAYA